MKTPKKITLIFLGVFSIYKAMFKYGMIRDDNKIKEAF